MDALAGVGSPELRDAFLYARGQDGAVTADDLAVACGIHRNVARSRLERLVAAGLLEAGYERRSGRTGPGAGRPAKVYSVAPELEAIEFPARRYEALVGLIVAALAPGERSDRLRDVGLAFGRQLADAAGLRPARTIQTGFERMSGAVRRLGYHVSLAGVEDGRAVIATATCPLRPLVRARPELAELDRAMWAGLASRAVGGLEARGIECGSTGCLDDRSPCRVVLRLVGRDLR
jgi:predicted ArsR family transcriptional regulator